MLAGMRPREAVYLVLALVGLGLTWWNNLSFLVDHGYVFDVATFVRESGSTAAARSLAWDLTIGSTAFLVWMWPEAKRLGMKPLLWFVLTMTIAFAFAAPLFLFFRERKLRAQG